MSVARGSVDPARYRRILGQVLPRVQRTEAENERLLREVNKLMSKPERELTPEEDAMLELLATLVERFEAEHYPMPESEPWERLRFLMEENGLRQRDLLDIFGTRSIVSAVLNGRRAITKQQAVKLGKRFSMEPAAFIEWPR
jgi:HTH-type transcriptional regulator / antitoxin HigA